MEIGETLYVVERGEWRRWLEANFESAGEIWLVYPNKGSGEGRILYNDAVEEALCFGWIDSIIKKLDPLRAVQRFSPRKARERVLAAEQGEASVAGGAGPAASLGAGVGGGCAE